MSEEIALAVADLATIDDLHAALSEATRRIVAQDAQIAALESRLGVAHATIAALESERDALRYEQAHGEPPF